MTNPTIITENAEYWVINKPAGYAVEPVGNYPTVLDWLVSQGKINQQDWPTDSRYGVIHRLDVDTSGILLWAKTPAAQQRLKLLWQGRSVEKTYIGLAVGEMEQAQGTVDISLMRDNKNDKQTVALLPNPKARPAITTYKRLALAKVGDQKVTLFEAHPITGRTHQIRVHMKYLGHPIVGDKLYGDKLGTELAKKLNLNRHFLHAQKLCLNSHVCFEAPLPEELHTIIDQYFPNSHIKR